MQSTARPEALTGEAPRPPSSREGDRRSGGRSKRIARPPTFRVLSKPRIQPRVQGRNPARFNGGYGVPRGFKGGSKPSAPCGAAQRGGASQAKGSNLVVTFERGKSKSPPNPLGLAERVYSFHRLRAVPLPRGGRYGDGKIESLRNIDGRAMRELLPPLRRSPSLEEGGFWRGELQWLDAFATDGCIAVPRRGAHCAPVRPRRYNNNPSRGRAKGLRGDRKAPISNRRQGRRP